MADEQKDTALEIDLTSGKFRAENIWQDLRPAAVPAIETLGNLFSVAARASGLTRDIPNDVIDRVAKMYREEVLSIPEEHRRRPPLRITSEVLEETAKCAEETELHKMFAKLLASASDSRLTDEVHPGFAKAIGQLTALDAKIIAELRVSVLSARGAAHDGMCTEAAFEVSQTNLIQLGIAELVFQEFDTFFINNSLTKFDRVRVNLPRNRDTGFWTSDMNQGKPEGLRDAAQDLTERIKREIEKSRTAVGISLTEYGRLFAKACLDPLPADTEDSTSEPSL